MTGVIDKLGKTPLERYQTLAAEAKRLGRVEIFSIRSWRQRFSKLMAEKYPSDEKSGKADHIKVYDYLFNLTADELRVIRVACIGEASEEMFKKRSGVRNITMAAKKAARTAAGGKSGLSEADKVDAARLDREYENLLAKIPPDDRTIANLVAARNQPSFYVLSYLRTHPDFAAKLVDGDTLFLALRRA
jgi:hypothetical protein